MDTWFLDNLEKLVPIVIALLYFLGASRAKKGEEEQAAPDPEADERARRIQEEIRRKILERQQRGKPPAEQSSCPPDLPTPEVASPFRGEFERPSREAVEERAPAPAARSEPPPIPREKNPMEVYEEQRRKIESQLRESRELAAKAKAGKIGTFPQRPEAMARRSRADRSRFARIIDDLDDPQSVRKAIVLKEILDPPVALR